MSIKESRWSGGGRYHLVEYASDKLVDALGKPLKVDDLVLRAVTFGRSAGLEFTKIREIKNGRVYLATSKVPVNYPSRLLIVSSTPVEQTGRGCACFRVDKSWAFG